MNTLSPFRKCAKCSIHEEQYPQPSELLPQWILPSTPFNLPPRFSFTFAAMASVCFSFSSTTTACTLRYTFTHSLCTFSSRSAQFLIHMLLQSSSNTSVFSGSSSSLAVYCCPSFQLLCVLLLQLLQGSHAFLGKLRHFRSNGLGHQLLHLLIDRFQFLIDLLHLCRALVVFPQLAFSADPSLRHQPRNSALIISWAFSFCASLSIKVSIHLPPNIFRPSCEQFPFQLSLFYHVSSPVTTKTP